MSVLILVRARALSEDQFRAILDFAKAGGTVIADIDSGMMTEYFKKLPSSSLAELFPEPKPRSRVP